MNAFIKLVRATHGAAVLVCLAARSNELARAAAFAAHRGTQLPVAEKRMA